MIEKYAVVTVTDGNYLVRSEHDNRVSAFQAFHNLCAALLNDDSFTTAMIKVLDENLDCVEGKMEYINRYVPEPEPEPEPEPAEE